MDIYAGVEEEMRVISPYMADSLDEQKRHESVLNFFNSVSEITDNVRCINYSHDIFIGNGSRVNIETPQFEPEMSTSELLLNSNPRSHKMFISQILAGRFIAKKAVEKLKKRRKDIEISLAPVLPWLSESPNGIGEHLHLSSPYAVSREHLNRIFLTLLCTDPSFCGVGAPSLNPFSGGFESSAKVRTHNTLASDLCQSKKPLISKRNRFHLPSDWSYIKFVNLEAVKSQRQMLLSCLKKAAVYYLVIKEVDFSSLSEFSPKNPVQAVKKFSFDLFGSSIRIPFNDGNSYTWIEADEKYFDMASRYLRKEKSPPYWFKWTIREWEYWRNLYLAKDYEKLAQISDKAIKLFLLFNPLLAEAKLSWAQVRDAGAIAAIIRKSFEVSTSPNNWAEEILSYNNLEARCKYYLFKPTFEYVDKLIKGGDLKNWKCLKNAIDVFFKICMIDFQYSFIGKDGIFEALDNSGCLNHRIVSEKEIAKCVKKPQPGSSRAMFRADLVKRYHKRSDAICDWEKFSVGNSFYRMPCPDFPYAGIKSGKLTHIIYKLSVLLSYVKIFFLR